jgi:hypothetical protein
MIGWQIQREELPQEVVHPNCYEVIMKSEKWAVTLTLEPQERLESRLVRIVEYLAHDYPRVLTLWEFSDLDATGYLGDRWTAELNEEENVFVHAEEFLALLKEGQIIELEARLIVSPKKSVEIIVRDGFSVDILGSAIMIPDQILGDFISVDPELFLWGNEALLETVS